MDVLIVDDDPEFRLFMRMKLASEAPHLSIAEVEGGRECIDYLRVNPVDCIISDYQMPGMDGMELLLALRRDGIDTPFVFVTGQGNEEVAREAFTNGADDYFTKEFGFAHFARIINSVEQAVRRRDAERALKEREFWLKESQRVARLGSYILDIRTGRWESSDILDEIFGIGKDYDKTVEGWSDIVHPDDRDRMMRYFLTEVLANKKRFEAEYRIARPNDGAERWVSGLGELVLDREGNPVKMLGTIQDITEHKKGDDALRESEKRFRALTENTSDWIWETDTEARYTYSSPRIKDILGYSPEEIIGTTAFDLMPHDEAVRVAEEFGRLASSMLPIEHLENVNIAKDGRIVVLETSGVPFFDSEGRFRGYRGIDRDITGRRDAEEALKFKNALLAAQMEVSRDGIFMVGEGDEIISYNKRFVEMWNIPPGMMDSGSAKLVREAVLGSLEYPEAFLSRFSSIYADRADKSFDEVALKDGRTFERYSDTIFGTDGKYYGRVFYFRDITERKRLDRQRADFYAMVTHDLKSPLAAILGYAGLISDTSKGEADEDIPEMSEAISRVAKKLIRLVEDFAVDTRLEFGGVRLNREPVDLRGMLLEVEKDFASYVISKGLMFNVDIPDGLPTVRLDRRQAERAVVNLLENAVSYTPAGATVTLKAEAFPNNNEGYVVVSVSDTGPGIALHELDAIFNKYYRSLKTSGTYGTGLGLAIVKAVAEAHGGKVEVDSGEGKGSTFRLFLPIGR